MDDMIDLEKVLDPKYDIIDIDVLRRFADESNRIFKKLSSRIDELEKDKKIIRPVPPSPH